MHRAHRPHIFSLPLVLICFALAAAQAVAPTALQVGTPVERTLGPGQTHNYTVALEQNQYLQLVVDQRGIDVIVRVFSPSGRKVGEFDSPNGDDGPENVTVVAADAGNYRIDVAPLGQALNPPPGKYEIKITEIRKATEEEIRAGNQQEQLKPKGRALVAEAIDLFPQVHRPETRAGFQMKAGQMLWDSDQKRATKLFEQATDSVKEFMNAIESSDREYYESFQIAQQLRQELVTTLTPLDPEMALDALRSTRGLANPEGDANQRKVEQQLELQLIGQLAAKDPRRSFQMAEDSLKAGASDALVGVVYQLSAKDQELASRLAHDIVSKLQNEKLIQNPQAGYLAVNLLNIAHQPMRGGGGAANSGPVSLLTADDIRDLIQKMVADALAYNPPSSSNYDEKRNAAQNLINTLKRMSPDLQAYAGDKKAALDEKLIAVQTTGNPQQDSWAKYQNVVNQGTPEAALESIGTAPDEMRSSLYEQLANKLIQTGDTERARAIVSDKISNPNQRLQAMRNLDRQAIEVAVSKGRIDEAVRILTNLRPATNRAQIIGEIVTRIGPGLKRAMAIGYLDQLAAMLDTGKATDQSQMFARLQLARAYSRYDVARAFDLMEPLLEQFNELASAAVTMNGFNQFYYRDGELITNNGNSIANLANQMSTSLAGLALMNFDRAKSTADRVGALDIRLLAYLTIAQQATRDTRGGVADF
jgi:hypothetical protein